MNGKLTLGENIADLGGLKLALAALAPQARSSRRRGRSAVLPRLRAGLVRRASAPRSLAMSSSQVDPHSPPRMARERPALEHAGVRERVLLPGRRRDGAPAGEAVRRLVSVARCGRLPRMENGVDRGAAQTRRAASVGEGRARSDRARRGELRRAGLRRARRGVGAVAAPPCGAERVRRARRRRAGRRARASLAPRFVEAIEAGTAGDAHRHGARISRRCREALARDPRAPRRHGGPCNRGGTGKPTRSPSPISAGGCSSAPASRRRSTSRSSRAAPRRTPARRSSSSTSAAPSVTSRR